MGCSAYGSAVCSAHTRSWFTLPICSSGWNRVQPRCSLSIGSTHSLTCCAVFGCPVICSLGLEQKTVPLLLQKAGYRTGIIGK